MKRRIILAIGLSMFALGLTTSLGFAQEMQPPRLEEPMRDPDARTEALGTKSPIASDTYWKDEDLLLGGPKQSDTITRTLTAAGGPDDYGYVWNDSIPFNWISAVDGTDTGINSSNYQAGPIAIGFNFKYYENVYNQLWVSRHGFLGFSSDSLYDDSSRIPYPARPNDVIAPHWVPSDTVTYVRYLRGGTAPNRWFVMEWNRLVSDYDTPEEYTFEVVLYEDGTIVFQYATMNATGSYWCQSSGIEDSLGIDGLSTSIFCRQIPGNRAVRISRPGPAARLKVFPTYYGKLASPGAQATMEIPVKNTGNVGPDTFDVTVSSRWPVGLFQNDGVTPLSDTDGDGVLDTGSLASGAQTVVIAKISTPATSGVGNSNQAALTLRSSRNSSKSKTVTLQTAIPAPFTQVFRDAADNALSLYLVRPISQQVKVITDNDYYGYDLTVVESSNANLLYAWTRGRCIDSSCNIYTYEVEYALVDHSGSLVRGVTKLTDHSGATLSTYDFNLAAVVAPNNRIGMLWVQELYDSATGQWNDNVFFAVLSPTGDLLHGPINLTNNTQWSGSYNVPYFYDLHITATGDNRFLIAWSQEHQETGGWVNDVWYTVWSTDGVSVRSNTKFTNDTPGWEDYNESPSLTAVPGNRVMLALERQSDIYFAVLNSGGSIVRGLEMLTNDGLNWGDSDSVRTSNGNIVVAWTADLPQNPGEQPWTARYYNNETLSGNPVLVRSDSSIDFYWQLGSPHPLVNVDNFSVRWEGTVTLSAGKYEFRVGSDDGCRVWIDGQLVLDHWNEWCDHWSKTINLSAGAHQVRMEMHEHDGGAWAYLRWRADTGASVRYVVLNPSFQRIAGPVTLRNEADLLGDYAVSVTADADGDAVLTWTESSLYRNLYYALVDGANGNVLTAPMIYRTSNDSESYVYASYQGNSNTSLIAQPWQVFVPMITQPKDMCEPNNGLSQAQCALKTGETYRAYLTSPGEWDVYAIDVPTDHIIEVWLEQIPTANDYDLYLFDAEGVRQGYSANIGNANEHIRTSQQLPGGRYYVAVKGVTGSSTTRSYSFRSVFR